MSRRDTHQGAWGWAGGLSCVPVLRSHTEKEAIKTAASRACVCVAAHSLDAGPAAGGVRDLAEGGMTKF